MKDRFLIEILKTYIQWKYDSGFFEKIQEFIPPGQSEGGV